MIIAWTKHTGKLIVYLQHHSQNSYLRFLKQANLKVMIICTYYEQRKTVLFKIKTLIEDYK